MRNGERLSLTQMEAFAEAGSEVRFEVENRRQLYEWVGRAPVKQEYMCLNREGKGVVRRSLAKMTGLSRAPVTRLIRKYLESGQVHCRKYRRQRFSPALYGPGHRTSGGSG